MIEPKNTCSLIKYPTDNIHQTIKRSLRMDIPETWSNCWSLEPHPLATLYNHAGDFSLQCLRLLYVFFPRQEGDWNQTRNCISGYGRLARHRLRRPPLSLEAHPRWCLLPGRMKWCSPLPLLWLEQFRFVKHGSLKLRSISCWFMMSIFFWVECILSKKLVWPVVENT